MFVMCFYAEQLTDSLYGLVTTNCLTYTWMATASAIHFNQYIYNSE